MSQVTSTASIAPVGTARLLVVEDDDSIRETVDEALQAEGLLDPAPMTGRPFVFQLQPTTSILPRLDRASQVKHQLEDDRILTYFYCCSQLPRHKGLTRRPASNRNIGHEIGQ